MAEREFRCYVLRNIGVITHSRMLLHVKTDSIVNDIMIAAVAALRLGKDLFVLYKPHDYLAANSPDELKNRLERHNNDFEAFCDNLNDQDDQNISVVFPADRDVKQTALIIVEKVIGGKVATKRSYESRDSFGGDNEVVKRLKQVEEDHAQEVQHGVKAASPSSGARYSNLATQQKKHPIYNGRPDSLHAPPLSIYHPVFADFKDALEDPKSSPTPNEYRLTHELFAVSANLYKSEADRRQALDSILSELFGHGGLVDVQHDDSTSTYGSILAQNTHTAVSIEILQCVIKNEIGAGHADPTVQGGMSARKFWVQSKMARIRNACCCPSFIVSISGPHMMISGAVLVDKFIVQPFTDYVWLGGDPFYERRLNSVAKLFHALAASLQTLSIFYANIKPSPNPLTERLFPYINVFSNDTSSQTSLEYIGRLSRTNSRRAIFEATLEDGRKVVVKFVEKYAADPHRLLAKHNLAPTLHYCGTICGGLTMVVMDLVLGQQDVYSKFPSGPLPCTVFRDVERAVNLLHGSGFVFGDLRRPNIMLNTLRGEGLEREVGAMLVDFDWCGKEGEVYYPAILNDTGDITWHPDVVRGGLMQQVHDLYMLDQLRCS